MKNNENQRKTVQISGLNGLSATMGQANRWWMALQLLSRLPLLSLRRSAASIGSAVAALSQAR